MVELDVVVLGAGTAGGYAAYVAKQNVDSVGIVEKGSVGGDCIFHACIPTKAMVHAARTYKRMRNADFFGLPTIDMAIDYKNVKAFKDRIVKGIGTGRDERTIESGIQLFKGNARFLSAHEVEVGNEVIKADKIIISTGSLPIIPPIPGLKEAGCITNIEALELDYVPERLAIVGGGPIGVEFAQIFAAFGSNVHIYEALDRILAVEDEDISSFMVDMFVKQNISVSSSTMISEVQITDSGKLVIAKGNGKDHSQEFDEILVATGRKPAIDDMNLEAAGIETYKKGITVDRYLQTSVPHIWAAGDVTGISLFTHTAWPQGQAAGINATSNEKKELDYRVLPHATFCDPEIAGVGLTERQAVEQGNKVKIGKADYSGGTRAIVADETDGFVKIIAEADSGQILGGHIVGAEASSLIGEVAAAMMGGVTASDLGDSFHAYPTHPEIIRNACLGIE